MERHTRSYLQLMKPGITLSNTISAVAGFFLASSMFGFSAITGIGVVVGVAFVIASACVVNNVLDRDIDTRMKRTKGREIAAGKISIPFALVYAFILGVIGFGSLALYTNHLTVLLGVIAVIWYVVIYGIAKRTTPLSTIIGGVAGALPPMAGYVAVSGTIDATAWVLFGLLMVWQLPHFYAISVFRHDDYKQAGLPVWSVRYGIDTTKAQILFWIIIFALLTPLLTLLQATGVTYLVIMTIVSAYWVVVGIVQYKKLDSVAWSRKMFGISLLEMLVMSGSIAAGGYLP